MTADQDVETEDDPELGNGERLRERLDDLDLDEAESASTDDMRDRLGL